MNPATCLAVLVVVPVMLPAQESPLKPVTVCEVLKDPKQYDGRTVAVLGRFSYRAEGRWISEDRCNPAASGNTAEPPDILWLSYTPDSAPRMTAGYQVDGPTVSEKIQLVKKRTSLGKFRFGSSDYDRWAVVYGRIKLEDKGATSPRSHHGALAEILYAGDGYVMFLRDPATQ